MSAHQHGRIHGTRDAEAQWARLVAEFSRCGVLSPLGAQEAFLRAGADIRACERAADRRHAGQHHPARELAGSRKE